MQYTPRVVIVILLILAGSDALLNFPCWNDKSFWCRVFPRDFVNSVCYPRNVRYVSIIYCRWFFAWQALLFFRFSWSFDVRSCVVFGHYRAEQAATMTMQTSSSKNLLFHWKQLVLRQWWNRVAMSSRKMLPYVL